jgi:hypothetical protein
LQAFSDRLLAIGCSPDDPEWDGVEEHLIIAGIDLYRSWASDPGAMRLCSHFFLPIICSSL